MSVHNIGFQRAKTLSDFMEVRRIRNQCREYMTRDTSFIGPVRQFFFWLNCLRAGSPYKVWLGRCYCHQDSSSSVVAFGIVRDESLLTGGLVPSHRGKGLGTKLFGFLASQCTRNPLLEVRQDNFSAIRTYLGLGWRIYSANIGLLYMELEGGETKQLQRWEQSSGEEQLQRRGFQPVEEPIRGISIRGN